MGDRRRWILVAAVLGSGIVFLDSTVVNVALPRIGRDLPRLWFGVLEGQSYVYNAYLLTLSALLILAGALNDYYGRKRMFSMGWSASASPRCSAGLRLTPSSSCSSGFSRVSRGPSWFPDRWRSSRP